MMRTPSMSRSQVPACFERRVGAFVKVREGLDQADRLVESFLVLAGRTGVIDDLTTVSLPRSPRTLSTPEPTLPPQPT